MADKVRWQFVYLRGVRNVIQEKKNYSLDKPFHIDAILADEVEMIRQKGGNDSSRLFNRYLLYFFCHKYIKMMMDKRIGELDANLRKLKEGISKWREKI